jgi:hypothetical protein
MDADLNMDSNKITNVVDPTSAQDGATKNYVDNNSDVSTWHQYTATSNVDVGDHKVINVNDPLNNKDAVNLQYFNDNNTIGNIKLKQVTHDDSFTLNDGGQHTDAKTVSGLDNNPYFIRIEILVWGDQLNGLNDSIDLQFLLQDDGFTDQYDPARQAISDGKSNQKFQLTNQTGIGVDGNAKTIYYNFCLLSNVTTSLTFNIDVIENGAFTGSMTVNTRLNAFITPASILI